MSSLAAARADNFYYPKGWDPSKVIIYSMNNITKNNHLLIKRVL